MLLSRRLRRPHTFGLLAFLFSALFATLPEADAATHSAVKYMEKVAADLLKAQEIGSPAAFRRMILRHADLPYIAMYSLGRYRGDLANGQKKDYYNGVNAFMGRYFADQTRKYRVAKADINANVRNDGDDVLVLTQVTLTNGSTYNVEWRLRPKGKSFKIADVKVLGFSMIYLQRGIFSSYIKEKGGNVGALITALNRHR